MTLINRRLSISNYYVTNTKQNKIESLYVEIYDTHKFVFITYLNILKYIFIILLFFLYVNTFLLIFYNFNL